MGERGRLEGGSQLFPEMGRAEAGRSCIALFGSPRHSHTAPHLTLHCSTMGRPGSPLFTLNPPPTPPCRYYRDALITMALAAAANSRDGHHQYVGVPLQVQVRGWKGGGALQVQVRAWRGCYCRWWWGQSGKGDLGYFTVFQ